jgi:CPA1 family monovalent cation:H+ antiporter
MTKIELAAIVLVLAAGAGFLNAKVFRLPSAIGLMATALVGSFILVGLGASGVVDPSWVESAVEKADFASVLMHGLLGLLLFAGALQVDLTDLAAQKWPIAALALGGTLLSTVIVASVTYFLMRLVGQDVGVSNALLFGALISPTDPIAVLAILKAAKVPPELATQIGGESLFNDGVGVVLFTAIVAASAGGDVGAKDVAVLFVRETLGGIAFGLAVGYTGFQLLRRIDDYSVEVLITLAMVVGGYAAAEHIHVSAPIAAVVAGLVVGNQGRRIAMSDVTRKHVDLFWELIDEILNAVLFLMLGLEATRIEFRWDVATSVALAVPTVLVARFVSVAIPISLVRWRSKLPRHAVKILTWGGLRGGISVALALSLPSGPGRAELVALTYGVVAFSILVQGLTLKSALRLFVRT